MSSGKKLFLALTILLLPVLAHAQANFRGTASVATGGGGPAFVREVDATFLNPANLSFQQGSTGAVVTLGRLAGGVGGSLLQAGFYNEYLTGGRVLGKSEIDAMLEGWFGGEMRSVQNSSEVVLAGVSLHRPGKGYGAALRLRSYATGRLNQGLFDLMLGGLSTARTVPFDAAINSFSSLDLSVGMGWKVAGSPWRFGVAPKLVMGLGYSKGKLDSEFVIEDQTVTHRYDYSFVAAGLASQFSTALTPFSGPSNSSTFNLGTAGLGLGVDLGATYQLKKNIQLAASLTDVGMVRWTKDAQKVQPEKNTFVLDEIKLDHRRLKEEYNNDLGRYMEDVMDSLKTQMDNVYGAAKVSKGAFSSALPTAFHLGGTWTHGMATFTGGVSTGLTTTGGFARRPVMYLGSELRLGSKRFYVPLRAGLRAAGQRALGVSLGVGLHTPVYDLGVGLSATPHTGLLGQGAQITVSAAMLTIRI